MIVKAGVAFCIVGGVVTAVSFLCHMMAVRFGWERARVATFVVGAIGMGVFGVGWLLGLAGIVMGIVKDR